MSRPSDEARDSVRIERTFSAPVGEVFEAWTSVEVLRRWWHAEHGWETPVAHLDLRVGGTIRVTMRDPLSGVEYGGRGEYTVIDRPRRLAFTWTWNDKRTRQLVDVRFTDHGDHTTVVLTNSGLREDEKDDHRCGWNNSFDNLEAALQQ